MKPFKAGTVIAAWLLRITLIWFVFEHYFKAFPGFNLKSFDFYIASGYMVFAGLLVIGGLMQRPAVTVISGLALFVLPIAQLVHAFPKEPATVAMLYLIPLAIGFSFFTAGNNT